MAMRRSGPNDPIRCSPAARSGLHGQEIAQQGTVRQIDGKHPAGDIGAPRRIVAVQHLRRARILARSDRLRTMSAISAASRNPMFRPCAPIGGST